MSIRDIVKYPDPFLQQKTTPVDTFDDALHALIDDMADTMYKAPGVGLAAPQIGIGKSIIVYDPTADAAARQFKALLNPEIVHMEGNTLSENEGCLSVPDFTANVRRAETIRVTAVDISGNPLEFQATGYEAIILQHEIDHLNGILFIDRISKLKREMYKRKRKKQLRQNA